MLFSCRVWYLGNYAYLVGLVGLARPHTCVRSDQPDLVHLGHAQDKATSDKDDSDRRQRSDKEATKKSNEPYSSTL